MLSPKEREQAQQEIPAFDIQHADATLESAVSNLISEGESKLEGDDWSYGYNVGITVKPVEGTEIGAHYRSAIKHELDGRISASGLTNNAIASNFIPLFCTI